MPRALTAADFDYQLPPELIAQRPASERGASRLLVLHKDTGRIEHRTFQDFVTFPDPGDALVLNTTRVIPARLKGTRENGRGAEVLLVHPEADGTWLAMVHPGGKLKPGRTIKFGEDATAEITDVLTGGLRRVRFTGLDIRGVMDRYGSTPLPPYITRAADAEDRERYQTVFAREEGSVAAPTAGLHFTTDLLNRVRSRGVGVASVILHVGPGTFKPVEVEDPARHTMHPEWYAVPSETANVVNAARESGKRIFSVGTTVARALEAAAASGTLVAGSDWTSIFIYPPYRFRMVDALLTNFHLPRSTLLMLVAASAGYDNTMAAYREAVNQQYRFYSYGDAMLVV